MKRAEKRGVDTNDDVVPRHEYPTLLVLVHQAMLHELLRIGMDVGVTALWVRKGERPKVLV